MATHDGSMVTIRVRHIPTLLAQAIARIREDPNAHAAVVPSGAELVDILTQGVAALGAFEPPASDSTEGARAPGGAPRLRSRMPSTGVGGERTMPIFVDGHRRGRPWRSLWLPWLGSAQCFPGTHT